MKRREGYHHNDNQLQSISTPYLLVHSDIKQESGRISANDHHGITGYLPWETRLQSVHTMFSGSFRRFTLLFPVRECWEFEPLTDGLLPVEEIAESLGLETVRLDALLQEDFKEKLSERTSRRKPQPGWIYTIGDGTHASRAGSRALAKVLKPLVRERLKS